jgi:hypothetical protein
MSLGARIIILLLILTGVDIPPLAKVSEVFGWTNSPNDQWHAPFMALSMYLLLIGGILGVSTDTRFKVSLAAFIIFSIQIYGNVIISYEYAITHPQLAQTVVGYMPIFDRETAYRMIPTLFGSAISFVSLLYWNVLAKMIEAYRAEKQAEKEEAKARLQEYKTE